MKSWIERDVFTAKPSETISLDAWEPWYQTLPILFTLQNSDIDDEHPEWSIQWIAGVATLRTIGHVLHKLDAKKSDKHRAVIDRAWAEWNANKDDNWIFFDFIEKERNNILKEFSFGATLPTVEDGRTLAYGNTNLDATELFREAVYWWRAQLRAIEKAISE